MNYIEFANEYTSKYKFLSNYVKNLNKQLELIDENLDFKERTDYKRRIYLIYTMCLELKHIGGYLKKCERRTKICQEKNCL